MKGKGRLVWASVVAGGIMSGLFGGCQHTLFSEGDQRTKSVIDRYYNGDSALETTESRKRTSGMGFGSPTGAAVQ